MDDIRTLNLIKEPFSGPQGPECFFPARTQLSCLQKVEISLRLLRGLSVIIGEEGAGKTTLCLQLIRELAADDLVETHFLADHHFRTPREFLSTVARMMGVYPSGEEPTDWQLKEAIKKYLFRKGISEGKTVVLMIDDGQKLSEQCLEILREFLNFETNEYKLLQIVIFADSEFKCLLERHTNFTDRINLYHVLKSMTFRDALGLVRFRIRQASENSLAPAIFGFRSLWAIYRASKGNPGAIMAICHLITSTLILQNRSRASRSMVSSCIGRILPMETRKRHRIRAGLLTGVMAAGILVFLIPGGLGTKTADNLLKGEALSESLSFVGVGELEGHLAIMNLEKTLARGVQMPQLLGEIVTDKDEWVAEMIREVYGVFNQRYLKAIKEANPHMRTPDLIGPGQVVRFPAIPVRTSSQLKGHWVQLARKKTLGEAFRFLRCFPFHAPPVRMVPCLSGDRGLEFVIVLKRTFQDETKARKTLERMPITLAPDPKMLKKWDKETVFFADPGA